MYISKLCWKMIRQSWKPIAIYGLLFLVFVTLVNKNILLPSILKSDKVSVLLINEGEDTILTDAFCDFMKDSVTYVKIPEKQYELRKDLFYDGIKCVIRLPKRFTADYKHGCNLKINRYHLVETDDSVRIELLINQFLQAYSECAKDGLSLKDAVLACNTKLKSETKVTYLGMEGTVHQKYGLYANYLAYVLMASIMSYVIILLYYLKQEKMRKRNEIAPIKITVVYRQAIFAACTSALFLGVVYILIGSVLTNVRINEQVILISINILIYVLFCVAVSILFGVCVSTIKGVESWEQVVALGSCFLSGVFVEQDKLPKTIIRISRCMPTYWFVKNNNQLGILSSIRFHDYQTFVIQEAIILCYVAILYVIAFIIIEKKVNPND